MRVRWVIVHDGDRRVIRCAENDRNRKRKNLNVWIKERLENHKRARVDDTSNDVEQIRQFFSGNHVEDVCVKNRETVIRAMKTHFFPVLPMVLPEDFTTLYIEHPVTKDAVPIWKYVLAVLRACGFDKQDTNV